MTNQAQYEKEYKKYLKKRSNFDKDYVSCLLNANFVDKQHIMLVGEEKELAKNMLSIFETLECEYTALEKVDLNDYWTNYEYGQPNKKR